MKKLLIGLAIGLVVGFGLGWVSHRSKTDTALFDLPRAVKSNGLTIQQ